MKAIMLVEISWFSSARRPSDEGAVRPVITSNGVPYVKMTSVSRTARQVGSSEERSDTQDLSRELCRDLDMWRKGEWGLWEHLSILNHLNGKYSLEASDSSRVYWMEWKQVCRFPVLELRSGSGSCSQWSHSCRSLTCNSLWCWNNWPCSGFVLGALGLTSMASPPPFN